MSRTPLTKSAINTISTYLAKTAAEDKFKNLNELRGEVAYAIYLLKVDWDDLKTVLALPQIFQSTAREFTLGIFDGTIENKRTTTEGQFYSSCVTLYFNDYKPFHSLQYANHVIGVVDKNHEKLLEYRRLTSEINNHSDQRDEARRKIVGLLSACKTVEKAIAAWPEQAEYLRGYISEADRAMPTVIVPDVEAALAGLR